MVPKHRSEQYDVQAVKERLNAFREGERELENQTEALERLKAKIKGVGAKEITDMPRSPSPPRDRITDLIYRKIELEKEIGSIIEEQTAERKEIHRILKQLRSADERAVIRFRYLLGMNWYDVTDAMFGAREDYLDKEESYQRRVYNIHGRALVGIAKYTEEEKAKRQV